MRIALAIVALGVVTASSAVAQSDDGGSPKPWPGYTPQFFRWNEDYRTLTGQAADLPYPLRLKYLPLDDSGQSYVSLGGEYRFRVDTYGRPDFGLHNAPGFTSLQDRFLVHADTHISPDFRVFVQLGYELENGRLPVRRPFDQSQPDVAQAFADVNLGVPGNTWRLRVGRQEVSLGRYIAVRDGVNIRRTFDGVKLDGTVTDWTITGLAAHATRNRPRAFDDDPDPNDKIALIQAEHPLAIDNFKFDLVSFQRDNRIANYAPGIGNEVRRTVSARIAGNRDGWDLDAQASFQSGTFAPLGGPTFDIRAVGAAFEGGRTLALPWSPRLAIRIDAAGGGMDKAGHRLNTFDLPYPNLTYLTDASIFAPRNVRDIQPFISVMPIRTLTLTAGAEFLWRVSANDAVFSAANTPIIGPGGHGNYVASEPYFRVDWQINPLMEWAGAIVYAVPGEVLRSFGGTRPLTFAYTSLTLRF